MSTTTLASPPRRRTPRQASKTAPSRLPAAVSAGLRGLGAAWRSAFRPAAAVEALTPMEEAARVRELAGRWMKTDPGFAADLFAAADRHERAHEAQA